VQAGRTKIDLQEDFPTLAQGNHVILGIPRPEGYHWLDCTSQVHPFGYVGDFTDDRKVLVVTPGGGEIVATKAYLNEENYIRTEADLKVLRDLSMEGELVLESGGVAYNDRFAWSAATKGKSKSTTVICGTIFRGCRFWNTIF